MQTFNRFNFIIIANRILKTSNWNRIILFWWIFRSVRSWRQSQLIIGMENANKCISSFLGAKNCCLVRSFKIKQQCNKKHIRQTLLTNLTKLKGYKVIYEEYLLADYLIQLNAILYATAKFDPIYNLLLTAIR